MALTYTQIEPELNDTFTAKWVLTTNETGQVIYLPGYADKSVQIDGNFTGGGAAAIEGSIDGVTFFPLTDPQGNAISKTANAIEAISEAVKYYRPKITGTVVSINIHLFAKGSKP